MPQLTPSDRLGTTVGGRYEIRRLLGEGGFSAVFEAVHSITGREVALKLLHPHLVTAEKITERFLMEARAMARIAHEGIVQVLDAGEDPDGTVYIALELLSGESLETMLQRVGQLTWEEAIGIGVDVLGALAETHRKQIIHRDIKPGNIFIVRKPDGSNQAKLLDFGIAHVAQVKGKLTQAGMILGTPEYMSPEQARSGTVGPEADLWSVGIVLYECLTGATPFMSESLTEILLKVQTEVAPRLIDVEPAVPLPVSLVVQHALAREVQDRYRSAEEMREALQRARVESESVRSSRSRPSLFRGPSVRREPPATMEDSRARVSLPPRDEPPGGVGRDPAVSPPVSRLSLQLGPPRPAKLPAASTERVPGGGRTFELPELEPPPGEPGSRSSLSAEPTAVIQPGRLVSEEVLSSRRLDEEEGRSLRRASLPSRERPEGAREASPFVLEPATERVSGELRLSRAGLPSGDKLTPTPANSDLRGTADRLDASMRGAGTDPGRPGAPALRSPVPSGPVRTGWEPVQAPGSFREAPNRLHPAWIAAGVVVLLGVGAIVVKGAGQDPEVPASRVTLRQRAAPPASVADASTVQVRVHEINRVRPPSSGFDDASEISRHAAVSRGEAITTQRVIVACVPSSEGEPTLYFHPLVRGDALGSTRAPIACAGFDLGVVPDVNGDGTDDVIAVNAAHDAVLLFDSGSRHVARSFPLPGARGIAVGGGFAGPGDTYAVVYTEPGNDQATVVVALGLRTGRILWRASGGRGLGRFGQPVELGLAIGPDLDRDGVPEVAVGMGPIIGRGDSGERAQRCVQVISGARGVGLWNPRCRARGGGSQSVALGPDVTGDAIPDLVVGTERPEANEPAVEIRSGADGAEVRILALPARETAQGFGWPVALLGPTEPEGRPRVVVGSVGGVDSGIWIFDAHDGALVGREPVPGVGSATLRLFAVEPDSRSGPWTLVVGTPVDGIRVLRPSVGEDEALQASR